MSPHEALPPMRNQAPDSVVVLRALLERRASDEPLLANARAARATTSVVPMVAGEDGGMKPSQHYVQIIDRPMSKRQVRAVRLALGMSQLEFAYYLRIGQGTVSRWENGHQVPSHLAEQAIKALCVAHGLDMREVA